MDAHLEIAALQRPERKRVVEVLGIGRVDGKGKGLTEVATLRQISSRNLLGYLICRILNGLFKLIRKVELCKDGMHLRLIGARGAEHIDNMAIGAVLTASPAFHPGRDLIAGLRTHRQRFLPVDLYVVRHETALHQHPGRSADHVEHAHERLFGALDDIDNLAFAALAPGRLAGDDLGAAGARGLCDGDTHRVAMKGTPRLRCTHEDILVFAVDRDEHITLAGHLDFAYELRKDGLAGLPLTFLHYLAAASFRFHNLKGIPIQGHKWSITWRRRRRASP